MGRTDVGETPTQDRPPRGAGRERPDPRPARLMMGAGALAAVTVIGAGLVDYPLATAEDPPAAPAEATGWQVETVERPVRYVRLKPGQQAPAGATVIREAAPTPRVIVRRVTTPAPSRTSRTVARSRQSG